MVLVRFASALMETLQRVNKDALQDFKLRVGIAVGPVIAGVVGAVKPQYDIWVSIWIFRFIKIIRESLIRCKFRLD